MIPAGSRAIKPLSEVLVPRRFDYADAQREWTGSRPEPKVKKRIPFGKKPRR